LGETVLGGGGGGGGEEERKGRERGEFLADVKKKKSEGI
jgi:hypothetical protein